MISRINRQELNKEYSDLGLYFKEDEYQSVVRYYGRKKRRRKSKTKCYSVEVQQVLGILFLAGFYVGAAKFGTGLAVSMLDPINIASFFCACIWTSMRFAALAARTSLRTARLARGTSRRCCWCSIS